MVLTRKSRTRKSEPARSYGHSRVQRSRSTQKRNPGAQRVKPQRPASHSNTDWSRVRIAVVGIILGLAWVVLWGRAYYVQIMDGPELAARASRQHEASEYVAGERGQIFDRKGRLLAKSVAIKSVFVRPMLVSDVDKSSRILSESLGLARSDIREKLTSNEKHVWIARQIGDKASATIKDAKLDGVYLTTEYGRLYPNKQLAGQLLGFVGTDDKGLEGLEASFDDQLVGRSSKVLVHRDATGHMLYLNSEVDDDAARGHDIRLTLDAHIQFVAEDAIGRTVKKYQANCGAAAWSFTYRMEKFWPGPRLPLSIPTLICGIRRNAGATDFPWTRMNPVPAPSPSPWPLPCRRGFAIRKRCIFVKTADSVLTVATSRTYHRTNGCPSKKSSGTPIMWVPPRSLWM